MEKAVRCLEHGQHHPMSWSPGLKEKGKRGKSLYSLLSDPYRCEKDVLGMPFPPQWPVP